VQGVFFFRHSYANANATAGAGARVAVVALGPSKWWITFLSGRLVLEYQHSLRGWGPVRHLLPHNHS